MAYSVELIRSRRRSLSLELKRDGTILVRAPLRMSRERIEGFVLEHRDWIEKRRRQLETEEAVELLSQEELAALKKRGREVFARKAAEYAAKLGVRYGRVCVRCQKSKWGSCSAAGNLNFNCLLLLAPEEVLDYVVVHELCHRLEMNHSPRFWQAVEGLMPDYRARRSWLKKNGGALMARAGY